EILAQATTPTATRMYSEMIMRMVSVASRPGVYDGFLVSSFIVSTTSQPQNMKIERLAPATNGEKSPISAGSNQSTLTVVGLKPVLCMSAATAKATRTKTWKATSRYWSFWVVANPQ